MERRVFLAGGLAGLGAMALRDHGGSILQSESRLDPAWAVIPVVGDGKWIWKDPPTDQTGYLDPRSFELSIGIELQGEGEATDIKASTPVPTEHPEQKFEGARMETEACQAGVMRIGEAAAMLRLSAPSIRSGQRIRAVAHYRLTLAKQYLGYSADQFSSQQPSPPPAIRKQYLQDSPGIQSNSPEIKKLLIELRGKQTPHPWEQALQFKSWIAENIEPKVGKFIGVINALKRRTGDCEEMAGIFVALCRAADIPARLVWVPNHNWAEFYLQDHEGKGHWIPVHTACYSWFGWTGAHELVIQKGDRITPPHERKAQRLLMDWMQWSGKRPAVRYIAELKPLPPQAEMPASPGDNDPGPGARSKVATGEWKLVGDHPMNMHMRNG